VNKSDERTIARQAKKIEFLEEKLNEISKCQESIHGFLFSIGSPLNDNILQYTHDQLKPFRNIAYENDSIKDALNCEEIYPFYKGGNF
jgi:hypothetical protein